MPERFKVQDGKMLVVDPDNESEWRKVTLVYDSANKYVGIQLRGESELKGFTFLIKWADFHAVMEKGKPVEELEQA